MGNEYSGEWDQKTATYKESRQDTIYDCLTIRSFSWLPVGMLYKFKCATMRAPEEEMWATVLRTVANKIEITAPCKIVIEGEFFKLKTRGQTSRIFLIDTRLNNAMLHYLSLSKEDRIEWINGIESRVRMMEKVPTLYSGMIPLIRQELEFAKSL